MLRTTVLTFVLAFPAFGQDAQRLDRIAQSYTEQPNGFMGSVLVAKGDHVLLSKGYGMANLEWKIPNAPSTRFRLGSITKQFTAASILLLEERGKLKVEDPVKKYLPDAPPAWDKITIYNLLTHTSGIPNFTGFPEYDGTKGQSSPAEKTLLRFRDKPLDFEPGSKFNYSNSGYVLLGYLVEKIGGEPYETFMQKNVFTPLGMTDSGYDSNARVIERRASGYAKNGRGGGLVNAAYIDMTVPGGAGGLYSTTEDLLKWEHGLFGGKVLSEASLKKMTTPFLQNYGFGLIIDESGGRKRIWHNGGIDGFVTSMVWFPDSRIAAIALSNLAGGGLDAMVDQLAAAAHGDAVRLTSERKEITLSPEILARYVGAYELAPGTDFVISLEGNQLSEKLANQPRFPLFSESETGFFLKAVDAQIEFPKTGSGERASQLILHQGGRDQTAKRLSDADAKKVTDAVADFDRRFKDQTAATGGGALLRTMIEGIRAGQPNYGQMSEGLAAAIRQQLPQNRQTLVGLGALVSLKFTGVGPGGADIYRANFEKGAQEYRIWLSPDGKVESANVRPAE